MAYIERRGKTWRYVVSHTKDGKRNRYSKSGFKTLIEAREDATEFERQLKQGQVPIYIKRTSEQKLLNLKTSEVLEIVKNRINDDQVYYLFLLGLTTGLRHSEIVDLCLEIIDNTLNTTK